MFYRVGEKLKFVAVVLCWIGIAASFYAGYKVMRWYNSIAIEVSDEFYLYLALGVVAGCFGSWLFSMILHGFGELVENSRQQKILIAKMYLAEDEFQDILDDDIEDDIRCELDMKRDRLGK